MTEVGNAQEALSASLNKFGAVDIEYMLSLLPGISEEEMLFELHDRIYYNPLEGEYEIAEKFISDNVVATSERIGQYLLEHPEDTRAQASLQALKDAIPEPIPFVGLGFQLRGAMDSRKSLLRLCLVPLQHGGDDTLQFKCGQILCGGMDAQCQYLGQVLCAGATSSLRRHCPDEARPAEYDARHYQENHGRRQGSQSTGHRSHTDSKRQNRRDLKRLYRLAERAER